MHSCRFFFSLQTASWQKSLMPNCREAPKLSQLFLTHMSDFILHRPTVVPLNTWHHVMIKQPWQEHEASAVHRLCSLALVKCGSVGIHFLKTDMGQMAAGQSFNSSAFIRSPRRRFWKLQLNLQPHYPGGDVVTLNVEVEQTGWKRQRWSVGERQRRERPPTMLLDDALICLCQCVCACVRVCV